MSTSPVLLGIDTSSDACSVALSVGAAVLERHQVLARAHTRLVLPMVQALLAEAGIGLTSVDAFVMGRGPGAFTGVRIAVGVVQGLAFSSSRPVVPVSSLATVGQAMIEGGAEQVAVAFDARMGQVYWGTFAPDAGGLAAALGEEGVIDPQSAVLPQAGRWVGAGNGFAAYAQTLIAAGLGLEVIDADAMPRARHALALGRRGWLAGEAVDAEHAQPVYLRDRVVRR